MVRDPTDLAEKFLALLGDDRQNYDLGRRPSELSSVGTSCVIEIIESIRARRPDLWSGSCLTGGCYPSHSEADFALVGLILRDALSRNVLIEDLDVVAEHVFRQSGLFRPEKLRTLKTQTIPKLLNIELAKLGTKREQKVSLTSSESVNVSDLLSSLALQESHVAEMQDAVFIVNQLIVRGHMVAIVAPANSGKTALLIHFAAQIIQQGYQLLYVNVDAGPDDLKRHFEHSKKYGYKLIAPDAIPGKSPRDVLVEFKRYLETGVDLSNTVIVLDTLKKFVDVIEKRAAKELYSLLRGLTVRGCTVVLLGHTNKHTNKDNQTIYEGTADLRNDVDELIYLDAQKDEAKSALRITTRPDKVRANIKPRSFLIHLPDRRVEELDQAVRILPRSEEEILDLAAEGIYSGKSSQKDLIEFIAQRVTSGAGEKKIKGVLATHALANHRIRVSRSGRAKDLVFSLTTQERARKDAENESVRNLPF